MSVSDRGNEFESSKIHKNTFSFLENMYASAFVKIIRTKEKKRKTITIIKPRSNQTFVELSGNKD